MIGRVLFGLLGAWLWASPAWADWAAASGQTCTINNVNDGTCTLPGAAGNGNIVVVVGSLSVENQTLSITGWTGSTATVAGPLDHSNAGVDIRIYVFCLTGDGSDTAFVGTTSGAGAAFVFAQEFTGGTCTQDGSTQTAEDTGSPYNLGTNVTVTNTNSLLVSMIRSTSAANFDPDGSFVQVGTDALAASMEYRILTSSGDFDTPWTSAMSETTLMVSLALQASGGGGASGAIRLLLLGVG